MKFNAAALIPTRPRTTAPVLGRWCDLNGNYQEENCSTCARHD